MFLHPHHFQQQDRHIEYYTSELAQQCRPYNWGFSEIKINQALLRQGKLGLQLARGIMPDGTPFFMPHSDCEPPVIDIPEDTRNAVIYLGLPLCKIGGINYASPESTMLTRYHIEEMEIIDDVTSTGSANNVEVAQANFRILLENQDLSGYSLLPMARILETREDQSIHMDENFIPACLDITTADRLHDFIKELAGLLHHRAEALAATISDSNRLTTAEFADYMMLVTVNRYTSLVEHIQHQPLLHPLDLFNLLLQIAGELTTFTTKIRRTPTFPAYQHNNLQGSFAPVINSIRQSLSKIIEKNAIALPLTLRNYGIRVAPISDRTLIGNAQFILAAKADLPSDNLRQLLPGVCKISSVEHIGQLVNFQLLGIRLIPMAVAPREIPYHAGFSYFELDKSSDHWSSLKSSGGFAMHVGEGFPGLELEFWAIRQ